MKVAGGSVDLPPYQLVDLDGPEPEIVLHGLTNPLSGGETVQLILTFATAGSVSLAVPVEPHAYDYATYSPPAIPTPTRHRPAQGATGSASPGSSAAALRLARRPRRSQGGGRHHVPFGRKISYLPNGPRVPASGS